MFEPDQVRGADANARHPAPSSAPTPTSAILRGLESDRRRLADGLQNSETRYQGLADAMPIIVWTARPDGSLDYYNRRWYEYTGLTPESSEGWGWQAVLHPDDLDASLAKWQHAIKTGEPFAMEFRIRGADDGAYRWHLGRAVALRDADGAILSWVGTATDIDNQKRGEGAFRYLAQADEILAESLDYETTLQSIARLAVPQLAEWCFLDLRDAGGTTTRVAVSYADPAYSNIAAALYRFPPAREARAGVAGVLSDGEGPILLDVTPELKHAIAQNAEHLALLESLPITSCMIVPLKVGAQTAGTVTFGRTAAGARFVEEDVRLATDLARRAAVAVERAQLYQDAQSELAERRAAELQLREETETLVTLNQVGQMLSAELNLDKLVQAVTDAATTLTGAHFGSFFYNLVDERGESYTLYTMSGVPRSAFDRFPMPRNTHLFGPTFRGEEVLRLADVHGDPRYGKNSPYYGMPEGHLPVTSYLAVPVTGRGGNVLGGLFFGHPNPGVFTERAERLVVGLAGQTAVAMDNARLYDAVQTALREREETIRRQATLEEQLTLLVEASSNLLGSPGLDVVVPAILDLSGRLIAADAYAVWRYVPATTSWRTVSARSLSPGYAHSTAEGFARSTPFEAPIVAENVAEAPALAARLPEYEREGIRSLLVVPLHIQGRISGSIAFYYHHPHHFDPIDVRVAVALGNIAGAAIGAAELYEEQRRLRDEAEAAHQRVAFLAEVSRVVNSSLNYATTLQSMAALAVPRLADWCTVEVLDPEGGLTVLAMAHTDPNKRAFAEEYRAQYPPDLRSDRGLASALRTGRSELVPEVTDAMLVAGATSAEHLAAMREMGIQSVMFVPLLARERILGVLSLAAAESGRHYGAADLAMAEEVARRAATAMDNARLYEQAQEAIRVREEFLGIASHELKTPLTGLQLQVQMLLHLAQKGTLGTLPPERLVGLLERAERQAKQLGKLTNGLLDVSRISAGRLTLDLEEVDLVAVVRSATDALAPELAGTSTPLVLRLPESLTGRWDAGRLEQVVTNLVGNAIKYAPGRTVEVTVGRQGDEAEFVVHDQGIGIAPADQGRVFDRFERAVGLDNYGGFGLGLYIVRQIVTALGGQVALKSAPGEGSTFTVRLPLTGPPAPETLESPE